MRISVENQWLDMSVQSMSAHWTNFRFTDIFADQYTTDIELPLSDRNIELLDVWGLHDRSGQLFGSGKRCQIVTARGTKSGTIRVSRIADTITATIFYDALPSSLNKKFIELVQDNSDTIVDWQAQVVEDTGNVHDVNISGYDYGIDLYSSPDALLYPNVKVNYLLGWIATASGVSIAPVTGDLRLLCTKRVLCPQATYQNVLFKSPAIIIRQDGTITTYGQHIATDRNGEYIKFNRMANVKLDFDCYGYSLPGGSTGNAYVQVSTDAGGTWTTVYTGTVTSGGTDTGAYNGTFNEGDMLRVQGDGTGFGTVQTFVSMQIAGYTVTDSDYGKAMDFINEAVPAWIAPRHDTMCYMYYGAICNLPDMTVKELLSGLAWMQGKKIVATATDITWSNADAVSDIDARITATAFASDKFGQINIFESADGVQRLVWTIDNSMLEAEKVVNKSVFLHVTDTMNEYSPMARVPQYAWELQGDGTAAFKVTEVTYPVLTRCETYILRAITAVNTLGLRTVSRTIEIEATTDEDVTGLDYVRINGHKYMLEDGDTDELTGLTTFKALLI